MYKLTFKSGSILFLTLEDLMLYVINMGSKLFVDGAYIKVKHVDDFCDDYLLEDLKK